VVDWIPIKTALVIPVIGVMTAVAGIFGLVIISSIIRDTFSLPIFWTRTDWPQVPLPIAVCLVVLLITVLSGGLTKLLNTAADRRRTKKR